MKNLALLLSMSICLAGNAQFTKLLDFTGTANGSSPHGSLFSDGTFLYGVTVSGGANSSGVIFKIKPDGTSYTKLLDFSGAATGSLPGGSLISDGTFLYGMTTDGGANGMGVVFKIKPDGTGFAKILDFAGAANGDNPVGSLISDGSFLYGMTNRGGTNDMGVIFKIKPDGTGFAKLRDFTGMQDGYYPYCSFITDGTFLYGMTSMGGTYGLGTVFQIKPDGTAYSTILSFEGSGNGSNPPGSLISDGTFLYGMTRDGGSNNLGVVFKIKPDGTGYSRLLDFAGAPNGSNPYGTLISDGTFLYGMTYAGGTNDIGVVFKIKPDGTGYSKLLDFAGTANGSHPYGSLISDGSFLYGMTFQGGSNFSGVIFKLNIPVGIEENTAGTSITIHPNPCSTHTILQTGVMLNNATLSVYNYLGQPVKQVQNISGYTVTLTRDELAAGTYFIQISQDNKIIAREKLVID
jgi:uncharacterized repeat protein (TIGR03803 family)